MTTREQGFLLLTGYLGDPERRPLTVAQFRKLTSLARTMEKPNHQREMTEEDLTAIGCDRIEARRVLRLLSQQEQLHWYLEKGKRSGCTPITRISEDYPDRLRKALNMDAPGVLWAKGDVDFLHLPAVALVGSRELLQDNRAFAAEVGKQAAKQGFVLVSGNARGADRTAQESCLACGGRVISVVADSLEHLPQKDNILYISEEGFDLAFSSHRALQRNRVIHSLADKTFIAQSTLGKGGTWSGACYNLRYGLSDVFCFFDDSPASRELQNRGATAVTQADLQDISALKTNIVSFC